MRKAINGFTIVELLIVIVVIAIRAAISVVAYNGIQSRARNSQQLSVANNYLKIFASYRAVNGSYPTSPNNRVCLMLEPTECTSNSSAWYRNSSFEYLLTAVVGELPVTK